MDILFKGKRLDNGKWVEGSYFANENGTFIFTFPYRANYAGIDVMVKVDSETICRYTELADMCKNKIFENDVVYEYETGQTGIVKFGLYDGQHYGFYISWTGNCRYRSDIYYWSENDNIKVIGNIFD